MQQFAHLGGEWSEVTRLGSADVDVQVRSLGWIPSGWAPGTYRLVRPYSPPEITVVPEHRKLTQRHSRAKVAFSPLVEDLLLSGRKRGRRRLDLPYGPTITCDTPSSSGEGKSGCPQLFDSKRQHASEDPSRIRGRLLWGVKESGYI